MNKHHGRNSYFIVGEGFINELQPGVVIGADTDQASTDPNRAFRFSRLFPTLPKLVVTDELLRQLGAGMLETTANSSEKTSIPAGYTYLGQFIDHDITFDQTEGIPDHDLTLDEIVDGRSPSLDLDSLYGRGPTLQPELYTNGVKLQVGMTTAVDGLKQFPNDLLRLNAEPPRAVIGDPRNDENLAVAQTHLAFTKFHNAVVDLLHAQDATLQGNSLFEATRTLVVQHYQHIVLTDFLPRLIEKAALDRALDQLRQNPPSDPNAEPTMPLEFAVAAFRLGHSMVRPTYSWNKFFSNADFFFLFIFTAGSGNLGGLSTLPSNWIVDWRRFYEIPLHPAPTPLVDGKPNMTRKIDTSLAAVLGSLPGLPAGLNSLAVRNLLRGSRLGLPSGQAIANAIGAEVLDAQTLKALLQAKGLPADAIDNAQLANQTPLWFYILAEAEVNHAGESLGAVGSHILATTFVNLIAQSKTSILRGPAWQPDARLVNQAGKFDMPQLLLVVDDLNPLEPKHMIHLPIILR